MLSGKKLSGISFILPRIGLYFRPVFDMLVQKLSFSISKSYEADDFISIKGLMEQGFGASLLPRRTVSKDDASYRIIELKEPYAFNIYFVTPKYLEDRYEYDRVLKEAKKLLGL